MTGRNPVARLSAERGLELPNGWLDYFEVTKRWNTRTDLTSARTDQELAEILFLDAAEVVAAGWVPSDATLVDVGAGVGAPSLPILASDPSLRGVLVEPRRIRTTFLRTAIGSLGLGDRTTVIEAKVDPEAPNVAGAPFDIALSRATFAPRDWMHIGIGLATEVWVLVAGSEPDAVPELELVRRLDYAVPSTGAPRAVLAYRRRRAGMI
jgi:16S rRNA (guanine527-N7)-methyltransferase